MQKILTTSPPSYEVSQGLMPGSIDHPATNPHQHQHVGQVGNAPVYVEKPGQPPQNPGYPALNPEHPAQNPGYPAQNPGYPAHNPGYPAQNPGYPAQNSGYPTRNSAYPAQNSGYPHQGPNFAVPEITSRTFVHITTSLPPLIIGPLGPHPSAVLCPRCNAMVTTQTTIVPNILGWASCAALMFFGCFFGCCLLPFCFSPCQNVEHFCPDCKVFLGKYNRIDCLS